MIKPKSMLNLDFTQRVVINTNEMSWTASPAGGVLRKPLERADEESGHATSIVRYEKGASFQRHTHPLGEEIFVLEGVFSDETGDYGKGCYIRNPPGSSHVPFSKEGCTILVKLDQFAEDDTKQVVVDTTIEPWLLSVADLQVMPLHCHNNEHVALVKWPANHNFATHRHIGGEEMFVLSGCFRDEFDSYPTHTWLRNPHLSEHKPFVEETTITWVKTGHLLPND